MEKNEKETREDWLEHLENRGFLKNAFSDLSQDFA